MNHKMKLDNQELKEFLTPAFRDGHKALNELNLTPESEVLDVGTGIGIFAIFLASQGLNVLTGEPEEDHTIYAKKNWETHAEKFEVRNKIHFTHFDASKMPFDTEKFDSVFFFGALHHIDENARADALSEALRVTKQQGAVVFFEPSAQTLKRVWENNPEHPDSADPTDYVQDQIAVKKIEGSLMDICIIRKEAY